MHQPTTYSRDVFSICLFLCVSVCVHTPVCRCIWRPVTGIQYHFQSLSTLGFHTASVCAGIPPSLHIPQHSCFCLLQTATVMSVRCYLTLCLWLFISSVLSIADSVPYVHHSSLSSMGNSFSDVLSTFKSFLLLLWSCVSSWYLGSNSQAFYFLQISSHIL